MSTPTTSPSPSLPPSSQTFYDRLITERGIDNSTDFSKDGHSTRFKLIHELIRPGCRHLLDFGCNVGDFYDYLVTKDYKGNYVGLDVHKPFVDRLQEKNQGNGFVKAMHADIMDNETLRSLEGIDYVIACGVFCHSDQQYKHAEMLARLWSICEKGMIVNFLSEFSPHIPNKPTLCWYHPSYAIALVERFHCHDFKLIQGYHRKNDFTLALYK